MSFQQVPLFPAPGMPIGAPHTQSQSGAVITDNSGSFEGMQFRIDHRDSNSILSVDLYPDYQVKARPGSMVAMDGTVQIKGNLKFSLKKMFTGSEMSESVFTGPGEVMLAPDIWGDIVPIRIDEQTAWKMGKDAFLACSIGITRTTKSQGVGKAFFSGEGLFVYHLTGEGIVFIQSIGAIMKKTLRPGEEWVVDNGHLVAWTAAYKIERIKAGGFISAAHTDEGFVCRFTGPGTVYIQTRNANNLAQWIAQRAPSSG